jgi:hypothetical protein
LAAVFLPSAKQPNLNLSGGAGVLNLRKRDEWNALFRETDLRRSLPCEATNVTPGVSFVSVVVRFN